MLKLRLKKKTIAQPIETIVQTTPNETIVQTTPIETIVQTPIETIVHTSPNEVIVEAKETLNDNTVTTKPTEAMQQLHVLLENEQKEEEGQLPVQQSTEITRSTSIPIPEELQSELMDRLRFLQDEKERLENTLATIGTYAEMSFGLGLVVAIAGAVAKGCQKLY